MSNHHQRSPSQPQGQRDQNRSGNHPPNKRRRRRGRSEDSAVRSQAENSPVETPRSSATNSVLSVPKETRLDAPRVSVEQLSVDSEVGFGDGIFEETVSPVKASVASGNRGVNALRAAEAASLSTAPIEPPPESTTGKTESRGRRRRRGRSRGREENADSSGTTAPKLEEAGLPKQADTDSAAGRPMARPEAPVGNGPANGRATDNSDSMPSSGKRRRRGRFERRGSKEQPQDDAHAGQIKEPDSEPNLSEKATGLGEAANGETASISVDFDEVERSRTEPLVSVEVDEAPEEHTDEDDGAEFPDSIEAVRSEVATQRREPARRRSGERGTSAEEAPRRGTRPGRTGDRRGTSPKLAEKDETEEIEDDEHDEVATGAVREMLINVAEGDECRIALLREGRLEELYIERASTTSNVGNIYKGRVTNVEPSIQAAFIDFGLPAHGFLHISDLHPMYFPDSKGEPELVGRKTPRRHRPPVQACLRPGQEIIVQVIKEGIGTKGPTLTSYISLPGRFLVMMPHMEQLGVSRKIEDENLRRELRGMLEQLSLPKGMGFIVRTAGVDRAKRDLQRDLNYLTRLWKKVEKRIKSEPAPTGLYKESDLVIRTIRDVWDSNLRRILVDSPAVATRVREFLAIASPRAQNVVEDYTDGEPLFHRHGIEAEIDKLHSKTVPLPCGGSLVIEQTEALVAIDVNSGRYRVSDSAEETAYRVNLEAVDEIARQLRLRDLGGLIILDLIDMTQEKHRRAVERRLSEALKLHKERAKILRISKFGILEMTRQRQRPSLAKGVFQDCPRCRGSGRIKAVDSVALDVMRQIRLASQINNVVSIDVRVAPHVAADLLNRKRHQLTDIERAAGQSIRIHAEEDYSIDEVRVSCTDRRGRDIVGPGLTPVTQNHEEPGRPPNHWPNGRHGRPHQDANRRQRQH